MPSPAPRPLTFRPLPPQPSVRGWHPMWLAAAIVLIPVVFWLQQYSRGLRGQTLAHAPSELVQSEELTDPGISGLTLAAKSMVRMAEFARSMHEKEDEPSTASDLDEDAVSRVDRLRVAIVAGEIDGPQAALERIAALQKEVEPGGDLARDLSWLDKLYREGDKQLPDEVRRSLKERHGWFGELALVWDRSAHHAARDPIVGGAGRLIAVMLLIMVLAVIVGIAGLVAAIFFFLRWRHGGLDSGINESVGGPLYLETFVIFLGGFLVVLAAPIVAFGFNVESTAGAAAVAEVLSWLLVASLAWPLFRGIPWSRFAWDVGWHKGEGVLKEIGCGALAYLATVPVFIGTLVAIWIVKKMLGVHEEKGPTGYPMFQPPPGGSWATLILMVLSLVIWAPLLEETIFRGALYRYLRPRLRWVGAVLVTGAVFGFIHPYSPSGLVQIAVMGVTFGLIREWRGSLIAPMTAHFLHNGLIALIMVLIVGAID